jgi:C-terminal processing protease CtpA/Prc
MNPATSGEREQIIDRVVSTIQKKLYDPSCGGVDITAVFRDWRRQLLEADDFEQAVNEVLKEIRVSHAGFFHESTRRVAAKIAISATFAAAETGSGNRWVFQDVHPGGSAHTAGLEPGDVLLRVAERDLAPPEAPFFPLGETTRADIEKRDGRHVRVNLSVPASKSKKRPLVVFDPVTYRQLGSGVGYIRVAMFPGVIGIDVAKSISAAVRELACQSLIFDLRGNTGGGIGCLRIMSLLTPASMPVGYSITRSKLSGGVDPDQLPVFDRIPESKWGLLSLIPRFTFRDRSIAIRTEGLGAQPYHGRIAILINEHSASSSEMVVGFAAENRLATLVGTRTPGRMLGANSFKVGSGFRLALPVVAYRTWSGKMLEGIGVAPDIDLPFSWTAAQTGADPQLEAAKRALTGASEAHSTVMG